MTAIDLLRMMARRWPVVVAGLAATAVLLIYISSLSGVYRSQVNVVLVPPPSVPINDLDNSNESLIATAGVIATLVNGPISNERSVSQGVSLTGEGVYSGYSVRQPNSGGQWDYRFDNPVLDVQATGATLAEAEANMDIALQLILDTLVTIQIDAGASSADMIETTLNPAEPQYYYDRGSRSRALGATVILTAALTIAAVIVVDRGVGSRPRRLGELRRFTRV